MAIIEIPQDTSFYKVAIEANKLVTERQIDADLQKARMHYDDQKLAREIHRDELSTVNMSQTLVALNATRTARAIALESIRSDFNAEDNRHSEVLGAQELEKKRLDVMAQTGGVVDTSNYRTDMG